MNLKLLRKVKNAVGEFYLSLVENKAHFKKVDVSYGGSPRNVASSSLAKKLEDAYMEMNMLEFLLEKGKANEEASVDFINRLKPNFS